MSASASEKTGRRLRVTLQRSPIGYSKAQKEVVRGLGLRRIGHTVDVIDHPAMRGMVFKIRHLVTVDEQS